MAGIIFLTDGDVDALRNSYLWTLLRNYVDIDEYNEAFFVRHMKGLTSNSTHGEIEATMQPQINDHLQELSRSAYQMRVGTDRQEQELLAQLIVSVMEQVMAHNFEARHKYFRRGQDTNYAGEYNG